MLPFIAKCAACGRHWIRLRMEAQAGRSRCLAIALPEPKRGSHTAARDMWPLNFGNDTLTCADARAAM